MNKTGVSEMKHIKGEVTGSAISAPGDFANVPIYVRLAMALRSRILEGEWKKGDRLPPFDELAHGYGVAVNTVRNAVRVMVEQNLVTSARGTGTKVIASSSQGANTSVRDAINDPFSFPPEITIAVLESQEVPSLCSELVAGYAVAKGYHRVLKTHLFRGIPFSLPDIYVAQHVYNLFPKGAERKKKLSLLVREYGGIDIESSREELTVTHADQRLSTLLQYPIAAPVVRLRRWRLAKDGTVVYGCVVHYRSDMFVWDSFNNSQGAGHFQHHIIPELRSDPVRS